jgi:polyphosphate kinase
LKKGLLTRIEREMAVHARDGLGHIQFKMNALEDADVVREPLRAARAGVRIDSSSATPAGSVPGSPTSRRRCAS